MNIKALVIVSLTSQLIIGIFQITLLQQVLDVKLLESKPTITEVGVKNEGSLNPDNSHNKSVNRKMARMENKLEIIEQIMQRKMDDHSTKAIDQWSEEEPGNVINKEELIDSLSKDETSEVDNLFELLRTSQISPSLFSEEFAQLQASLPIKKHGMLMMKYSKAINNGWIKDSDFVN